MNDVVWKNSSKTSILKKGAHFLYGLLIAPKSLSEDDRRREFILNIILLVSIVLLLWSDIYLIYSRIIDGSEYKGVPVVLFNLIVGLFVALYVLSRSGFFVYASYALVATYFIAISYASYQWGTDLPTALLSFGLLVTVASILISTRFSFFVVGAITVVILGLIYLEHHGLVMPARYWLTNGVYLSDGVEYSIILIIITVVSWLSNREIDRSLKRARTSEAALKEQRDLLEITVEERTKQLQSSQAEKIDQLYRFAEFGRLASGLFHDLMNPLTSISLYLEKINTNNPSEAEATKDYLEKAFAASKRIETFTQAVKKQLQHREAQELFSLNEGVRQAVQLVAHKAWEAHVQITFHAATEVVTYDNPLKFHQIVVNLLSNAIDAYREVPITQDRKREVAISLLEHEAQISLVVQDWGCGMDEEIQKRIFQPFYTTKGNDYGMGIGLSTTKDIIERDFRGSIAVESTEGLGSTFRINFPQHDPGATTT